MTSRFRAEIRFNSKHNMAKRMRSYGLFTPPTKQFFCLVSTQFRWVLSCTRRPCEQAITFFRTRRIKIGWVSDWVRDFSPWTSSATEAAKDTKLDVKVA